MFNVFLSCYVMMDTRDDGHIILPSNCARLICVDRLSTIILHAPSPTTRLKAPVRMLEYKIRNFHTSMMESAADAIPCSRVTSSDTLPLT